MKVYSVREEKAAKLIRRLDGRRGKLLNKQVFAKAQSVVTGIRRRGDQALLKHIRDLDLDRLGADEIQIAGVAEGVGDDVPEGAREAIDACCEAVRKFHARQEPQGFMDDAEGSLLAWRVRPIASVGVVVPGHEPVQLSSLIMTVIPARVAGVERVAAAVSPRAFLGSAALRYALERVGVDEVYLMGGAHAVAALAYGTESVRAVDLIVACGGPEIQAAKLLVAGDVAVDLRGGPAEVVIVADPTADPDLVAADLISQLEHDADALGLVITTSKRLADRIDRRVRARIRKLDRGHPVREALKRWGAVLIVGDMDEACVFVNKVAPSRVQLLVDDPLRLADRIDAAALILLGEWTPPALADVAAGINHVLPTMGSALVRGPLSVHDFVRTKCVARLAAHHYPWMARNAAAMAEVEQLPLHAEALEAGPRGER